MEVHRQRCQSCGSLALNDLILRERRRRTRVFVRCARCGEFVAQYSLSNYYHHGKGLDSYLRGLGMSEEESGRQALAEFRHVEEQAMRDFDAVMEALERAGKTLKDDDGTPDEESFEEDEPGPGA